MSHVKIMIVEENPVIAADLADILVESGYDVVGIAPSGEDALSMARHNHLDLILMDIMVNRSMNGVSTAAEILTWTDLPIIYMSPFADEDLVNRAKEILPYGFLTKPVKGDMMLTTIRAALTWHACDMVSIENEPRYCAISYRYLPQMKQDKHYSLINRKNSGYHLRRAEKRT